MMNIIFKIQFLATFCFLANTAVAQHQAVFPNDTGDNLLDLIEENYRPPFVPSSSDGKDILYGEIYTGSDNVLSCVYTGYTTTLDPNADPSTSAFDGNINLEHTYPKSMVANGPAEQDLHNLFPTNVDVNQTRGNAPFAEIPDNQTDEWFYLDQMITSIPNNNIDEYSEYLSGVSFEPREDHKGNVARAMMYVFTVYNAEALQESTTFFEDQRLTLCQWHLQDPVDEKEWDRTWEIAEYQGGVPNPFVLDCTIPQRTYCQSVVDLCTPNSMDEAVVKYAQLSPISPNPVSEIANITYHLDKKMAVQIEVVDMLGKTVEVLENATQTANEYNLSWSPSSNLKGLFLIKMTVKNEQSSEVHFEKILIL